MKKSYLSLLTMLLVGISVQVFARSVEWNLERYEPHYIKIKTALDDGDLEKAQDNAEYLVRALGQESDQGNTEADIKYIEASARSILNSKNIEKARHHFKGMDERFVKWKTLASKR